jgi:hypothetical protein
MRDGERDGVLYGRLEAERNAQLKVGDKIYADTGQGMTLVGHIITDSEDRCVRMSCPGYELMIGQDVYADFGTGPIPVGHVVGKPLGSFEAFRMGLNVTILRRVLEALRWCSGSPDFNEGGQARPGWVKMVQPVMRELEAMLYPPKVGVLIEEKSDGREMFSLTRIRERLANGGYQTGRVGDLDVQALVSNILDALLEERRARTVKEEAVDVRGLVQLRMPKCVRLVSDATWGVNPRTVVTAFLKWLEIKQHEDVRDLALAADWWADANQMAGCVEDAFGWSVVPAMPERKPHPNAREAVRGFMAWLRTVDPTMIVGSGCASGPLGDLGERWCNGQGLGPVRPEFGLRRFAPVDSRW